MTQPGFATFWPTFAEIFDQLLPPESVPTEYEKFMISILPDTRQGRIVEFGSGTGRYLLPLAKNGMEVLGVDIDKNALNVFESRAADYGVNVRTAVQDFLSSHGEITDSEEKFDVALIAGSTLIMMTSDSQKDLLNLAKKSIHSEGFVVIETHNRGYIERIHKKRAIRQIELGHVRGNPVTAEAHWIPQDNIWELSYRFIRNGAEIHTKEISVVLPSEEIIQMAHHNGLALSRVMTGWNKKTPESTSPTLVYLFQPFSPTLNH